MSSAGLPRCRAETGILVQVTFLGKGCVQGKGFEKQARPREQSQARIWSQLKTSYLTLGKALKDKLHHRINLILSQRVGEGRVCCPGLLRSHLAQGNSSGKETVFLCVSKKYCYAFSVQTSTNPEPLHS